MERRDQVEKRTSLTIVPPTPARGSRKVGSLFQHLQVKVRQPPVSSYTSRVITPLLVSASASLLKERSSAAKARAELQTFCDTPPLCCICVLHKLNEPLETHHIDENNADENWYFDDLVKLCGSHHNRYPHHKSPKHLIKELSPQAELGLCVEDEFKPSRLLQVYETHRSRTQFAAAYQCARIACYIVGKYSQDYSLLLQWAGRALDSLRPKYGDLSERLFLDTIYRSALPYVQQPDVSGFSLAVLAYQVGLSYFGREDFEAFEEWCALANTLLRADLSAGISEQSRSLSVSMQQHTIYSEVEYLGRGLALRTQLDSIAYINDLIKHSNLTIELVNAQHAAIASIKAGEPDRAVTILEQVEKEHKVPITNLPKAFRQALPEVGQWLMIGYWSILVQSKFMQNDTDWIPWGVAVFWHAKGHGITNAWVTTPPWLSALLELFPSLNDGSDRLYRPIPLKLKRELHHKLRELMNCLKAFR